MEHQNNLTPAVIRFLRFPLAMCVVLIHSYVRIEGWSFEDISIQNGGSNFAAFSLMTAHTFPMFAVGLFYLISGYLFFQHLEKWNWETWHQKIKRRVFSLLIPYLLWNALYYLYLGAPTIDAPWIRIFWCNPDYPILLPFYFIRELMVAIAFSPLFYFLLKPREGLFRILAVLVLVVMFVPYMMQYASPFPGFSYEAFFFFGIGSYLALNHKPLSLVASRCKRIAVFLFPCLFFAMLWFGSFLTDIGMRIYPFYILSEIIALFCLAVWIVKNRKLQRFTSWFISWQDATFLIFAFHIFLRPYACRLVSIMSHLLTNNPNVWTITFADQYPFLVVFFSAFIWFVMLGVSMIVYRLLHRFTPRFCSILCGRRIKCD